MGEVIDLVDLPGTYTLSGSNPAEAVAKNYLASKEVDVIINVLDASRVSQSLELTLELLRMNRPLILAMNMMDEVARLGIQIDGPKLENLLKVPILPLVAASRSSGVSPTAITCAGS